MNEPIKEDREKIKKELKNAVQSYSLKSAFNFTFSISFIGSLIVVWYIIGNEFEELNMKYEECRNTNKIEILDPLTEMKNGRLECKLVGASGWNGQCMKISLTNKTPSLKLYKFKSAVFLAPKDTIFQRMISTKTCYLTIGPNDSLTSFLYAMCSQHSKYPPGGMSYTIAESANDSLLNLVKKIEIGSFQNDIGQAALWAYTDFHTSTSDPNFPYSPSAIIQVRALLADAGISRNF